MTSLICVRPTLLSSDLLPCLHPKSLPNLSTGLPSRPFTPPSVSASCGCSTGASIATQRGWPCSARGEASRPTGDCWKIGGMRRSRAAGGGPLGMSTASSFFGPVSSSCERSCGKGQTGGHWAEQRVREGERTSREPKTNRRFLSFILTVSQKNTSEYPPTNPRTAHGFRTP